MFSDNCRASAGSSSSPGGYRGTLRGRQTRGTSAPSRGYIRRPAALADQEYHPRPAGVGRSCSGRILLPGRYLCFWRPLHPLNDQRCCSIYPITFGTYLINELFKLNRLIIVLILEIAVIISKTEPYWFYQKLNLTIAWGCV